MAVARSYNYCPPFRFLDIPTGIQIQIVSHIFDRPWTIDAQKDRFAFVLFNFFPLREEQVLPRFNIPMPPFLISKDFHDVVWSAMTRGRDNIGIFDPQMRHPYMVDTR